MLKSLILFAFTFLSCAVSARSLKSIDSDCQQELDTIKRPYTDEEYARIPYWIEMMDEPNANYFEVQRAFNLYWKDKTPPVREDNEARDIFNSQNIDISRPSDYVYEYKRYKFWERYYKDLLDVDGFIMSPERIYENWLNRQSESIKE
jgi:hypothetical protein